MFCFKTLQIVLLSLLHINSVVSQTLRYELTNSYHTVVFNWSSDCSALYELNCTTEIEGGDVYTGNFSAVQVGNLCQYRQFGFQQESTYSCCISSYDLFMSSSEEVTTLLSRAPSAPQRVTVHNATTASIVVSWDPPDILNDLTDYYIRFSPSGRSIPFTRSHAITSFLATGLEAGTSYSVTVYAQVGSAAAEFFSTPVLAMTRFEVPSQPLSIEISRTRGGLSISWTHNFQTSNTPVGFNVSYEPLYSLPATTIALQESVQGANERSYTLTSLVPNLSYRVTVAAYNSAGTSAAIPMDAPPYIAEASIDMRSSRRPFLQLRFTGANNCTEWNRDSIALELFKRLAVVCPSCGYDPWTAYLHPPSIACSGDAQNQDELVFQAQLSACNGDFLTCDLSSHIEFFHSLPSPFLLFSNAPSQVLVLDKNCPLYADSARSSDCLSGAPSPLGAIVGGLIGGLVAGAVIASGAMAVVFFLLRKKLSKKEREERSPHPTTRTYPANFAAHNQSDGSGQQQHEEPGYEFLPLSSGMPPNVDGGPPREDEGAEYDIPQVVLTGLPPAVIPATEYECMDPPPPPKVKPGGKKGQRSRGGHGKKQAPPDNSTTGKKKSKAVQAKPAYLNVGKQYVVAPSKNPSTVGKGSATQQQGAMPSGKGSSMLPVGKGSSSTQPRVIGPPPPPPPPPPAPEEGVASGFEALQQKFATNTTEGQGAAESKKKPLIPKTSIGGFPDPQKVPLGLPPATRQQGQVASAATGAGTEVTPPVLPKPKKLAIATLENKAYSKRQEFAGAGFQNVYQQS